MRQYICDRCGTIIPMYNHYNHVMFYNKDGVCLNIQDLNNKYKECDLCDDCLEYLHNMNQAFMESYELVVK